MDNVRTAYVVDALRTPLGRRNGILSNINSVDLLSGLMKEILSRNEVNPKYVEDVIIGCVDQVGEQGANIARNAWLSSGFPESTPGVTIDRQCGSSLQAVQFAASGVMSGIQDLVVAGGVESMTRVPMFSTLEIHGSPITGSLEKRYNMGGKWFSQAAGAEMIAREFGIGREELDNLSLRSHVKAGESASHFKSEIVPVEIDNPEKPGEKMLVDTDEGVRKNTSLEKLAALKPAFEGLDLITAGNSSQISDGASVSVIASEKAAKEFGLEPRLKITSLVSVGVDPITMLKGPIPATEKVLSRTGLTIDDIDVFEVNEAFAPVVLAWKKHFGVPIEKLNIHGGAIAIGHPLGATGTRILATMQNILVSEKKDRGLIAICEGGGMANAAIVERV